MDMDSRTLARSTGFLRGVLLALALAGATPLQAELTGLAKVKQVGTLQVAVYESFPPFSYRSEGRAKGVDVDLAHAIAAKLGVNASIRLVAPDETMEDDLRIYVWKGHYLNSSVADLMLHVPYDPDFSRENDKVAFVAPYYREQLAVALDGRFGPRENALDLFTREKVGVELDTLADFYLLGAYNGAIRDNVVHFRSVSEAGQALMKGELAGIMAPQTELEAALGTRRSDYRVGPVQTPGLRQSGWDIGGAVKRDHEALAKAIDQAVAELREAGTVAELFQSHGTTYRSPSVVRLAAE